MSKEKFTIDQSIDQSKMLELYWNYFEVHANQRMQMINFYITIEIVLIGAFFTLRLQKEEILWAECLVAVAIPVISLIFFLLDLRTRLLIKEAENCIKQIEAAFWKKQNKINMELLNNIDEKTSKCWIRNTYSRVFWMQFFIVSVVGLILLVSIF